MKAIIYVNCEEADEYTQRFVDEVLRIAEKKVYFEVNLEVSTFKEWS